MKEITRIHIAKITYSIELDAKESIEKYLESLEAYSDDKELTNDIEIRITELLGERGIKSEGVIGEADVTAIRHQLGEPKDFMTDESSVDAVTLPKEGTRKLYRDLDNFIVGGVLSGIASYFKIKPLWTRLIFIALTVVTSGLSILLYILLWAIIPPAKTAADKLQMQGRPVTLASIRELNDLPVDEYAKNRTARVRKVLSIILGAAFIGMILVVVDMYITIWLHNTYTLDGQIHTYFPVTGDLSVSDPIYLAAYVISGVSLVAVCCIGAVAAFTRKVTKRKVVGSLIVIALTGLIVGGAYGFELYKEWQFNQQTTNNTREMQVKVPEGFSSINALVADIPAYIDVTYIVDPSLRSITFKSTKGLTLNTSVAGKTANITFNPVNQPAVVPMSAIKIYGPALDTINTKSTHLTYRSNNQATLTIDAQEESVVTIDSSSITAVTASLNGGSNLVADSSSIETAEVNVSGSTYVKLGTIKSLNVTNPDVCAVDTVASIEVHTIRDSTYTHNGVAMASNQSFNDICIVVTIDPQL
jgi:phage shock protein PspC (stress-responsive transcriptional regulator)